MTPRRKFPNSFLHINSPYPPFAGYVKIFASAGFDKTRRTTRCRWTEVTTGSGGKRWIPIHWYISGAASSTVVRGVNLSMHASARVCECACYGLDRRPASQFIVLWSFYIFSMYICLFDFDQTHVRFATCRVLFIIQGPFLKWLGL